MHKLVERNTFHIDVHAWKIIKIVMFKIHKKRYQMNNVIWLIIHHPQEA